MMFQVGRKGEESPQQQRRVSRGFLRRGGPSARDLHPSRSSLSRYDALQARSDQEGTPSATRPGTSFLMRREVSTIVVRMAGAWKIFARHQGGWGTHFGCALSLGHMFWVIGRCGICFWRETYTHEDVPYFEVQHELAAQQRLNVSQPLRP